MKHLRSAHLLLMALLILLAACGPKATPTQEAPPATAAPATQPPVAATDTATETAGPPTETPTLTPAPLVGPEMKLGSTYFYVDGSFLFAVPNEGPVQMGRPGSDSFVHEVTVDDFWMYVTKVTNRQYAYCVKMGKCTPPNLDDNPGYNDFSRFGEPVTGVTWAQADTYCGWVNARLPYEAEFEKAAAWDPVKVAKNIYPWGDSAPICDRLNFNNCIGKTTNVVKYTKGVSAYGGMDMAGNAYEWMADWYDALYYKTGPSLNPFNDKTAQQRSVRSSSYRSNTDQAPSAVRFYDYPDHHRRDLGFRCVVKDPMYWAPWCEIGLATGSPSNGVPVPGTESQLNCPPAPSINVSYWCNHAPPSPPPAWQTAANLTFVNVPGGATTDPGTCGGGPSPYVCLSDTSASIHWSNTCSFTNPTPPSCPVGYHQVGNSCEPDQGWQGQCPDGTVYDTVNQCCEATSGANDPFDLPGYCPAGQVSDGMGGCQNIPLPPDIVSPINVGDDCSNPGNQGCPNTCPPYQTQMPDCSCVYQP